MRILLILLLTCCTAAAAETNLVFNGDFELQVGGNSPPVGWAMWGDEQFKNPKHFTRDVTQPHGGKSSLRIEHPADTGGYLSQAPDRMPPAKVGTTYDLWFFARADNPGRALAGIGAYAKTNPLVDAPQPGSWGIELSKDWQQYHVKIVEGLDFDSRQSPFLQVFFKAAVEQKESRVMWVDDIRLLASPNLGGNAKLLALGSVPFTPINHDLTAGDTLTVAINAAKPVRDATREAAGVSFHRLIGHPGVPYNADGRWWLPKGMPEAMGELALPMTRFYGVGDEKPGIRWSIDHAAEMGGVTHVPLDRIVLELEDQYAKRTLTPEAWADAVKYSVGRKLGFSRWEIGNEVYGASMGYESAFAHPDDYVAHVMAVSKAIRAVQPTAKIGISIRHNQLKWGSYVMARLAGAYDFVCPHLYGMDDARTHTFEQIVLDQNYRILDETARLKGMLAAYNPGKPVGIIDTEWGMHSFPAKGQADDEFRNANIMGVMHRAVRLIYYTREAIVDGASGWGMFGKTTQPGFTTFAVDKPNQRTMLFWLYRHFIEHTGDHVLPMTGTAPFATTAGPTTPMIATLSGDGKKLFVIVANGSWTKPQIMDLTLNNFVVKNGSAIALSQDSLDASPILPDAKDPAAKLVLRWDSNRVRGTLPPHAIVFITATK